MTEEESESYANENIIKVLIATDNHLGYNEKHSIRGEDSFTVFEEILELAVEQDVDFILLGGDLFHEPAPTQNTLNRCLKLLRRYTLGDKQISVEFLSDQAVNFPEALNQTVNYEDPNLNVSIPVFSIHGNHDDPSGFGRLSSLDLLATSGLINYFGRWTDLTKVDISPLLLRKGDTQIALYGLSHIPDARLARLFQSGKVVIEKPAPETGEWFNIMVLHQNRADRGLKNYIPEEVLPDFMDLVIWGHEHDCRIVPEENHLNNFFVCQPGSSVATSLAEGEAIPKHVGLLFVHKKLFKMETLPLKTVRPFVFESITLSDYVEEYKLDEGDTSKKVIELAKHKIESMLQRATELNTDHPKQPKLPLIRLRIIYNDEQQMFNAIRFGQQYNEKVANPTDLVSFKKFIKRTKIEGREFDKNAMNSAFQKMDSDSAVRPEDIVDRYFEEIDESQRLQLLTSKMLSEMCFRLVHNDADAAENIVKIFKDKSVEHLMNQLPDEESLPNEIKSFKEKALATHDDILKLVDSTNSNNVPKDDDKNLLFQAPSSTSISNGSTSRSKKADATATTPKKDTTTTTKTRRGRGAAAGGGSTRGGRKNTRAMPELDVSISSRQPSLLETIEKRNATQTRRKKSIVYEVSDDDSD